MVASWEKNFEHSTLHVRSKRSTDYATAAVAVIMCFVCPCELYVKIFTALNFFSDFFQNRYFSISLVCRKILHHLKSPLPTFNETILNRRAVIAVYNDRYIRCSNFEMPDVLMNDMIFIVFI